MGVVVDADEVRAMRGKIGAFIGLLFLGAGRTG
jgi:hypothetical protein